MNCPKCGAPIHEELGRCLVCDWESPKRRRKKRKQRLCPECGDVLVKGICYRCGYRSRRSRYTCPVCKGKLDRTGRCPECGFNGDRAGLFVSDVLFMLFYSLVGIPVGIIGISESEDIFGIIFGITFSVFCFLAAIMRFKRIFHIGK